ncbi:MAG: hypothetical protein D6732_17105 [Methanobacteriota archaeon]|nr:MAG: hypothetical protein D6732_17105 [Euryarchaeota archaeon]
MGEKMNKISLVVFFFIFIFLPNNTIATNEGIEFIVVGEYGLNEPDVLEIPNHLFVTPERLVISDKSGKILVIDKQEWTLEQTIVPFFSNGSSIGSVYETISFGNGTFISLIDNGVLVRIYENGTAIMIGRLPIAEDREYLNASDVYHLGLDMSDAANPMVLIQHPTSLFLTDIGISPLENILNFQGETLFANYTGSIQDPMYNISRYSLPFIDSEMIYYGSSPIFPIAINNTVIFEKFGWNNGSYGIIDRIMPNNQPSDRFHFNIVGPYSWFGYGAILSIKGNLLNVLSSNLLSAGSISEIQGIGSIEQITSIQYDLATNVTYIISNKMVYGILFSKISLSSTTSDSGDLFPNISAPIAILMVFAFYFLFFVLFAALTLVVVRKIYRLIKNQFRLREE